MQIPNCVPEYYRELEEKEAHEYEKAHKRDAYYEESRQKLEWAKQMGWPILSFGGYDKCHKCKYKFDVQTDAEDDTDTLICLDRGCVCHLKGE